MDWDHTRSTPTTVRYLYAHPSLPFPILLPAMKVRSTKRRVSLGSVPPERTPGPSLDPTNPTLREQGLGKDGFEGIWCSRCGMDLGKRETYVDHRVYAIRLPRACPGCGCGDYQTYPPS